VTGDSVVLDWRLVERIVGAAKEKFAAGWGKFDAEFFASDRVFSNSIQEEWGFFEEGNGFEGETDEPLDGERFNRWYVYTRPNGNSPVDTSRLCEW
jgi:hypothetical protein